MSSKGLSALGSSRRPPEEEQPRAVSAESRRARRGPRGCSTARCTAEGQNHWPWRSCGIWGGGSALSAQRRSSAPSTRTGPRSRERRPLRGGESLRAAKFPTRGPRHPQSRSGRSAAGGGPPRDSASCSRPAGCSPAVSTPRRGRRRRADAGPLAATKNLPCCRSYDAAARGHPNTDGRRRNSGAQLEQALLQPHLVSGKDRAGAAWVNMPDRIGQPEARQLSDTTLGGMCGEDAERPRAASLI